VHFIDKSRIDIVTTESSMSYIHWKYIRARQIVSKFQGSEKKTERWKFMKWANGHGQDG